MEKKSKKYVLLIKEDSGYVGYYRFQYRYFEDYLSLQRHLLKFRNIPNNYVIFEETNITLDKTLIPKRKIF